MTPYEIELLLWLYYTPSKIEKPRDELFYRTMDRFVNLGLVIKGSYPIDNPDYEKEYYGNSEALKVYVEALKAVPYPVQRWVIPTTKDKH